MWCSVDESCRENKKTWPAEVRYGFEQFESKSCSEILICLDIVSWYLGTECCLVLVCRAGLLALEPFRFAAVCDYISIIMVFTVFHFLSTFLMLNVVF